MIQKGDKVIVSKILKPSFVDEKCVGMTGVVINFDWQTVYVQLDSLPEGLAKSDVLLWYKNITKIDDTPPPFGYSRCKCGTITTKNICCDCKQCLL